jgi:hypothetical protein
MNDTNDPADMFFNFIEKACNGFGQETKLGGNQSGFSCKPPKEK